MYVLDKNYKKKIHIKQYYWMVTLIDFIGNLLLEVETFVMTLHNLTILFHLCTALSNHN